MWKEHMIKTFKCTSHRIECVNITLIQAGRHACMHACHTIRNTKREDTLTHSVVARGVVDISHTCTLPKMLCYALFCVAHTCKRTTSFAACTQNTETTDDKKRKHINHPDAERRRCAFRRDSLTHSV